MVENALYEKFAYYLTHNRVEESVNFVCPTSDDNRDPEDPYSLFSDSATCKFIPDEEIELVQPPFGINLIDMIGKALAAGGFKNVTLTGNLQRFQPLFEKLVQDSDYKPSKKNAVAMAMALELPERDLDDFMAAAGYRLSRADKEDLAYRFFIQNKIYDFDLADQLLESQDLPHLLQTA